jgi:hypothetical protein
LVKVQPDRRGEVFPNPRAGKESPLEEKLEHAAVALAEADPELAVSLVALLQGVAPDDQAPEHPTLRRLARFAAALRAVLHEQRQGQFAER